jgi:hypothetical protein
MSANEDPEVRIIVSRPGKRGKRWREVPEVTNVSGYIDWLKKGGTGGKYARPHVTATLLTSPGERTNVNLDKCYGLNLDADKAPPDYIERIDSLGLRAFSYSTASWTEGEPRWRTFVPFDRVLSPAEKHAIGEYLIQHIGIGYFDRQASTSPAHVAYAPSWDDTVQYVEHGGKVAVADDVLFVAPEPTWTPGSKIDVTLDEWTGAYADQASACSYGRDALNGVIARLESIPEGQGVHTVGIFHAAARAVELVSAGCWSLDDVAALRAVALGLRAEPRPEEFNEALVSALEKGTQASTECSQHCVEDWGDPDVWDAVSDFEPVDDAPEAETLSAHDRLVRREAEQMRVKAEARALLAAEAAGDAQDWTPIDLKATLEGLADGTLSRPTPSVGDFGRGCLFYAGKVNGVHGDSTAGKSWTALVTTAQELNAGNAVVYVDLEDDEQSVLSRLVQDLGVEPEKIMAGFVYLRPGQPFTPTTTPQFAALLASVQPSLVVLDSTGEALAVSGVNPNADDEVARWFTLFPRVAADSGAAVVLVDHATKAGTNELWPIGSQRKRAAISGAAYLQKVITPFSRENDGYAVLKCAKDRHGTFALRQEVAFLRAEFGALRLEPSADTQGAADWRPTALMEKVSRLLEGSSAALSTRQVRESKLGNKEYVTKALAALVADGYVSEQDGSRKAKLHSSLKPYRENGLT